MSWNKITKLLVQKNTRKIGFSEHMCLRRKVAISRTFYKCSHAICYCLLQRVEQKIHLWASQYRTSVDSRFKASCRKNFTAANRVSTVGPKLGFWTRQTDICCWVVLSNGEGFFGGIFGTCLTLFWLSKSNDFQLTLNTRILILFFHKTCDIL